jgi:ABC-type uncharacterized transport system ATPase component
MVTHSMRQALDYGDRTVMLHQGNVILDVQGEERRGLDVPHLLQKFEETRGAKVDDDAVAGLIPLLGVKTTLRGHRRHITQIGLP